MLKIVYHICCGIDVHRDFVYTCIATTEYGVTTYKSHLFSTFIKGLRELLSRHLSNNCKDVCMESTGKYGFPVYNILENAFKIVLAHPKHVKVILGKKRKHYAPMLQCVQMHGCDSEATKILIKSNIGFDKLFII